MRLACCQTFICSQYSYTSIDKCVVRSVVGYLSDYFHLKCFFTSKEKQGCLNKKKKLTNKNECTHNIFNVFLPNILTVSLMAATRFIEVRMGWDKRRAELGDQSVPQVNWFKGTG